MAAARVSNSGTASGDAVEEAAAEGRKRLTALPLEEVEWILAQKPLPLIPSDDEETLLKYIPPEMIPRIMETERRADEASAAVQKEFFEFQDLVRKEFEEKGVVMVDDEFLAGREQTGQWLKEKFDDLFTRLGDDDTEVGSYSDLYATDDDEEDEGVLAYDMYATDDEEDEEEVALESTSN
ncbi:hypothetical protein PR202_gb13371 [Eleusine coracana subsp. coracana]|uniref:Uncharacterized protein n=1 Tax=Eleusine coracana subsp. coracana TaxID=191504 RepID=A0AAV5ETK8_ELECO|nr:hypothetical protein PR202_gb13371 [Eleusine coracana subsp. coracana]